MKHTTLLPVFTLVLSTIIFAACSTKQPDTTSQTPVNSSVTTQQENLVTKTLTTTTSYISPGGEESVAFNLTVTDSGEITSADTTVQAKNPTSVFRQNSFAKNFSGALVGKNINELESVDRIGGSSLTTAAFNKAIVDLQNQM